MDADNNITYIITFDGYVELDRYRYLYFLLTFALYCLLLCCNFTIVCLIWFHKTLHEPMYIFIAALLINSVLYSTTIYPKLLSDVLSEKQTISYSFCLFQGFAYYTLVGSEFLLLAVMAYDRYVSICKPLQYPIIMRKTAVNVCLVLVWLIPALENTVSVVLYSKIKLCSFTLKAIFCNNSGYKLQCISSLFISVYGVFILINIGFLPLLFILFSYSRILRISYQSCRKVRKKAAQTCSPHLLVLIIFSGFVVFEVILVCLESHVPKTIRLILTFQAILFHPFLNLSYMDSK
ncbi:olfactory receptor 6N2-like [Pholidichthys leucotaenia]